MHRNPYRFLRVCAWSGPVFLILAITFWSVMGHNLPPFSAAWTPDEFMAHLLPNLNQIKFGMVMTMVIAPLYLMWGGAISKVMEAVHGPNNILAELQIWGAGFTTLVFVIPCGLWTGVTFRAETMDPPTLQFMFDCAWTFFDCAFSLTSLQFIAFGVAFLADDREKPLVPRWVSWFGIWVGVSFFLLILMPFFKDGPFSRSGLLNYWVEFGAYFVWAGCASTYIIKAIPRLEAEWAASR